MLGWWELKAPFWLLLTCTHDEPIFGQCLSYTPSYQRHTWCFRISAHSGVLHVATKVCLKLEYRADKCHVVFQIIGLCRLGYLLESSQSNTCGGASVVGRMQHPLTDPTESIRPYVSAYKVLAYFNICARIMFGTIMHCLFCRITTENAPSMYKTWPHM